ncbi:MAG: A/G-specific adenine glycosylase [Rhizobiales bacterium]|nr:A/G-specific adenine glycosylase [Hyphomicrobiales bacterium]
MSQTPTSPMAKLLLDWYDRHRRTLPWRALPGETADPYKVWLSEIMLQQTTVATVGSYFRKFVDKWPTVTALATAELDAVLRQWAGLGYYARARNLHKCAQMVVSEFGGRFPCTEDKLLGLPGIGPYTAAAIAAIAFDRPAAAIDGNVERVIARLYAIETPLPDAKPEIKARTLDLVPAARPGDFAQALMDLGATICAPRKANCLLCPWQQPCAARAAGIAETLPRKKPKAERPTRHGTAFWVENADGWILLRRRPEQGLLGGMMEIPSTQWSSDGPPAPESEAPVNGDWQETSALVEHTFTHFHLRLKIWRTSVAGDCGLAAGDTSLWVPPDEVLDHALPTVMKKIVAVMAPDRVRPTR